MQVKNKDTLRGHEIVLVDKEWLYQDTMTPTAGNNRACGECGKCDTKEGHDGCLGTLPNIMNACCGHGDENIAYVQRWDGEIVSGKEAIEEIECIKDIYAG